MKAVFFDAGGTLIHIDYARVAATLGRVLGRAPATDAFVAAEYAGRDAVEAAMCSGLASSDHARWGIHFRAMLGALGIGGEAYERAAPVLVAEHKRANLWTVPAAGAADALAALRQAGYRVACISNADGTVERLLKATGLLDGLEFVIDSGAVGVEKPDSRIFVLALERAGVEAREAVYVGDLYPIDVVGARAAGLEPILLDPLGRYGRRDCRTAPDVPSVARELVAARAAA